MNDRDLAASYRFCGDVARREARNFYYSFLLLPADRRRSMCALYAFLRHTDDLADEPGPPSTRSARRSADWRRAPRRALSAAHADDWPGLPALADTVARHAIPARYLHEVIDGVAMDLEPRGLRHLRRAVRLLLPRRLGRRAVLPAHLGLSRPTAAGPRRWPRPAGSRCN